MATYSASDFIGKTIYITGTVPVYKYATAAGNKRPAPSLYLNDGDSFTVNSYINKKGVYTNFDDNYWQGKIKGNTYAIAFKDIAGKYNAAAILSQGGIKSDEQKQKEQKEKEQGTLVTMLNKYLPLVLGAVVLTAVIRRRG